MFQEHKKDILKIVVANIAILLIAFTYVGLYSVRTDTAHYINQVQVFRGNIHINDLEGPFKEMFYYKISKPVYGILGMSIFRFFSPENSILFTNIIFLFGLGLASYFLFLIIGFNNYYSRVGSLWLTASYPVLKYGLALVTDISGWFFLVLSVAVFLHGFKNNSYKIIALSSLLGFLGSITKETGVLGLVFAGVYLILHFIDGHRENFIKKMLALCLPFFVLQVPFMIYLKSLNGPSEMEWIKFNYRIFFHDFYKLKYFMTNEFLAFTFIWFFFAFGLYSVYRSGNYKLGSTGLYLSAIPSSLLVLLWPVFYYRILFAQLILVLPLALTGYMFLRERYTTGWKKNAVLALACLPPTLSVVLFLLITKY